MERVIKMPQRVPYGGGGISFSTPGGMGMRRDHNILCSLSYLSSQWCGGEDISLAPSESHPENGINGHASHA